MGRRERDKGSTFLLLRVACNGERPTSYWCVCLFVCVCTHISVFVWDLVRSSTFFWRTKKVISTPTKKRVYISKSLYFQTYTLYLVWSFDVKVKDLMHKRVCVYAWVLLNEGLYQFVFAFRLEFWCVFGRERIHRREISSYCLRKCISFAEVCPFRFSFVQVSRLLDLIVHSLYSHKEVFLRELVR